MLNIPKPKPSHAKDPRFTPRMQTMKNISVSANLPPKFGGFDTNLRKNYSYGSLAED